MNIFDLQRSKIILNFILKVNIYDKMYFLNNKSYTQLYFFNEIIYLVAAYLFSLKLLLSLYFYLLFMGRFLRGKGRPSSCFVTVSREMGM